MRLTVAWNVYNNYNDVLISSEIINQLNYKNNYFDEIYQISQGGFIDPPSKNESKYLTKHFKILIDENNELIKKYKKHIGILRLVEGLKNAYEFARENNSDYLIISNADSTILDFKPINNILKSRKMIKNCIGIRKGYISGVEFNSGSYVPFFDDHFIIFNMKKCNEQNVFAYDKLNFLDNTLIDFYGIHYFIKCFLDERIPFNQVYEYTNLLDAVNHYGEPCGSSLLPLQFQKELKILHANTTHGNNIHKLRAYYFKIYNLDQFEETKKYIDKYLDTTNIEINTRYNFPYFKLQFKDKIKNFIYLKLLKLNNFIRIIFYYKNNQNKKNKIFKNYMPINFYNLNKHIYPINISGREK